MDKYRMSNSEFDDLKNYSDHNCDYVENPIVKKGDNCFKFTYDTLYNEAKRARDAEEGCKNIIRDLKKYVFHNEEGIAARVPMEYIEELEEEYLDKHRIEK